MNDIRFAELKLAPFAWGLSAALVVLYVLCWLAVLVAPQLAHGWLGLFSTEPAGSVSGLAIGVVVSIVMGWVASAVLVSVYNSTFRR
jgi:uncharacterized membrane protein (DUF485 family)